MLKVLRDNLKYLSWILWVVILVFIAFVFVDFGGGLGAQRGGGSPAATVGDETVSWKAFEREYRRLESQYRQAFGGQLPQQLVEQLRLPMQALDGLVDRRLLAMEADRLGIRVTDGELRDYLLAQPLLTGESGGFIGGEVYERFVRSNGFASTRDFEEAVREDLVIQKLTGSLSAGVAIDEKAVEASWREANERASVRYLHLPSTRFAAAARATDEEVRAWFESHRDDFHVEDQRSIDYLLVDATKLRETLEIPEADVENWYRDNAAEFSRPEEVQARHILIKIDETRDEAAAQRLMETVRARLARGEAFETVAAELSEDPGSRERGGDLGWFGRGRMIAEFEQAAFGAAPGSVVGPVKTTFGLHLIQVLDRRDGGTETLAEAAPRIRARLAGERAREAAEARAAALARRIADEKRTDAASWQELADEPVVTLVSTSFFGRADAVPGIGRNPAFADAAFTLAAGAASAPVEVPRGFAVLRLREEKPAHPAELAEVEASVRAAVERDKALGLARAELERARARVADGAGLDAFAAELGLEVVASAELTRTSTLGELGSARPVVEAALALAPGQIGGPVELADGALLFEVTARDAFDVARFQAEREETRTRLRDEAAGRLLASLLAERRAAAGVTYDRALMEQFGLAPGRS